MELEQEEEQRLYDQKAQERKVLWDYKMPAVNLEKQD